MNEYEHNYEEKNKKLPVFWQFSVFMSNVLKSIMCAPAPYRVLHRRRSRQLQAHRY